MSRAIGDNEGVQVGVVKNKVWCRDVVVVDSTVFVVMD